MYDHRKTPPKRLHQWSGRGDVIDLGESPGMDSLHGGDGWGVAPIPADSLLWSEKVPPTGVSFHPEYHPRHMGALLNSGRGTSELLPSVTFPRSHREDTREGRHTPVSQAGWARTTQPKSVRLGELDGLICHHSTPVIRFTSQDRVTDWGPPL